MTEPTITDHLAALEQSARRISVGRSDGYIEIAIDGNEVYGFTEDAIDEADSKAVLTFGETCAEIGKNAAALHSFVNTSTEAMKAALAEIEGEIEQRKTGGNAETWAGLAKVTEDLRAALHLVGTST